MEETMNAKKSKTTLWIALIVLAILLSACGADGSAPAAPTAEPDVAEVEMPAEEPGICDGKVGFSPDGKTECPGDGWKPSQAVIDAIYESGKKKVRIPSAYTWNGESYVANSAIILRAADKNGLMEDEVAEVTLPDCPDTLAEAVNTAASITGDQLEAWAEMCGYNPDIEAIQPFTGAETNAAEPGTLSWPKLKAMLEANGKYNDPYNIIDLFDAQSLKQDHPTGGWTVDCASGDAVVWSGVYVEDPSLGGNADAFPNNDGKTGSFVVTDGTTFPTPAGSICISGYDNSMPDLITEYNKPAVDVSASNCIEASKVTTIIDTFSDVNVDQVFINLDVLVDNKPAARLRASGPGKVNANAYIWTSGNVSGSAKQILESNGKKLFKISGKASIDHAFSGVMVCGGTASETSSNDASDAMCIPAAVMDKTISDNRGSLATREKTLYPALADLAADYPDAVTTGTGGDVTVFWLTSVLWVENGASGDVMELDTQPHNSLWLATTDGKADVKGAKYHHFRLCSVLNPERDFDWWGKN